MNEGRIEHIHVTKGHCLILSPPSPVRFHGSIDILKSNSLCKRRRWQLSMQITSCVGTCRCSMGQCDSEFCLPLRNEEDLLAVSFQWSNLSCSSGGRLLIDNGSEKTAGWSMQIGLTTVSTCRGSCFSIACGTKN